MFCYKKIKSVVFDWTIPLLCFLAILLTIQCVEVLKHKISGLYQAPDDFIFIGGVPRSGTTLMRVLLDAHGDIRCGEETRVIPDLLQVRHRWEASGHMKLLNFAGVTHEVLKSAIAAFIKQIIKKHGRSARRLCNKDPMILSSLTYLNEMFPKAKYILMIRDGRATVHSIIKRQVPVIGFNMNKPEECLKEWNRLISSMYAQCIKLGRKNCLPVYYERLVLHPRREIEEILHFIGVPWSENVLHHQSFIGRYIKLSPFEFSTSQVKSAITTGPLAKWKGFYDKNILERMESIAPMLTKLGYNATDSNPDYTKL